MKPRVFWLLTLVGGAVLGLAGVAVLGGAAFAQDTPAPGDTGPAPDAPEPAPDVPEPPPDPPAETPPPDPPAPPPTPPRSDPPHDGGSGIGGGAGGAAAPGPFVEITPELEEAVRRGLEWLKTQQHRDGSWAGGEYPISITALVGLAYLANGSTTTRGPYAMQVRKAVRFLLASQSKTGLFIAYGDSRPMYGHGFAMLFLGELYGMTDDAKTQLELRNALRNAVKLTAKAQSRDGGWYYTPDSGADEGSVTITQIQGLRACRNAGIKVPKGVIERALQYIRNSQDPDGGVRYTVHSGQSSLALTSAGLAVLYNAGDYESDNVVRALSYVRRYMTYDSSSTPHFHYTHFYAAQAIFQQGGSDWAQYFPRIREKLLAERGGNPYWQSSYGNPFGTSLALLILQIPYRYLPIYER